MSFDGVNASDTPRRVKLVKQSTDGTGSPVTPVKITGSSSATVQAAAVENFSAEPTDGDILWDGYVTPAGGRLDFLPLFDSGPGPATFRYAETSFPVRWVETDGTYAFIAANASGLGIVDISDCLQ